MYEVYGYGYVAHNAYIHANVHINGDTVVYNAIDHAYTRALLYTRIMYMACTER